MVKTTLKKYQVDSQKSGNSIWNLSTTGLVPLPREIFALRGSELTFGREEEVSVEIGFGDIVSCFDAHSRMFLISAFVGTSRWLWHLHL